MAESQIADMPTSAAPLARVTKPSEQFELLAVNATFDGSAAATSWLPAVEIVSDAGVVVARHVAGEAVAAGDTAEVTFAPFLRGSQTTSGFIRFDFDNQGGYLNITARGEVPGGDNAIEINALAEDGGSGDFDVHADGHFNVISNGVGLSDDGGNAVNIGSSGTTVFLTVAGSKFVVKDHLGSALVTYTG